MFKSQGFNCSNIIIVLANPVKYAVDVHRNAAQITMLIVKLNEIWFESIGAGQTDQITNMSRCVHCCEHIA